jgi:hypothetical protein
VRTGGDGCPEDSLCSSASSDGDVDGDSSSDSDGLCRLLRCLHAACDALPRGERGAARAILPLLRPLLPCARRMRACDLAGVLSSCCVGRPDGSKGDVELRWQLCELCGSAGAAAFEGAPHRAAEALYALGRAGVHPRRFVDGLLACIFGGAAGCFSGTCACIGGCGSASGGGSCDDAGRGCEAGGSWARQLRRLASRQLQLTAAALATLRAPEECAAPVGALVGELCARLEAGPEDMVSQQGAAGLGSLLAPPDCMSH